MANRIEAAIARINQRLQSVPQAKQEDLHRTLKTDWDDLCQYQKLQSAAFACGKLTLEEAQTLYQLYGGEAPSPDKWGKLSLAEKVIGTQTAGELAQTRICDIL